jgi:hypothetical protein
MRNRLYARVALVVLIGLALLMTIFILAMQFSGAWELGDFHVTFYRVARYFLRGENVYVNSYPHPYNGSEYPPFEPIWSLYVFVPFGALPLPVAEALRVVLDIMILPFLAYLSARWARLPHAPAGVLLVLAPWLLTEVHSGQLTPLVFLGTFLCYWGVRKPSALITAVGLWLALAKFNLVALVLLTTIVFAWRRRILVRTVAILSGLIVVDSLASPLWFIDLAFLYIERLTHPRVSDSILLFPGYPWGQLGLLFIGTLFLIFYVWHYDLTHPSPWLWAVMLGVSLVGALHTFIYDWQLLMPLLALLLRSWWGGWFTVGVYAYSLSWVFLAEDFNMPVPSLKIVPGLVLALTFIWGLARQRISVEGEIRNESSA